MRIYYVYIYMYTTISSTLYNDFFHHKFYKIIRILKKILKDRLFTKDVKNNYFLIKIKNKK